jgi:hypothetical protein
LQAGYGLWCRNQLIAPRRRCQWPLLLASNGA